MSQPHLEIQMCPSGCTNELLSPTIHMVYSHTVRATNWVAIMEIFEIQVKVAIFPLFRIQVSSGLRLSEVATPPPGVNSADGGAHCAGGSGCGRRK